MPKFILLFILFCQWSSCPPSLASDEEEDKSSPGYKGSTLGRGDSSIKRRRFGRENGRDFETNDSYSFQTTLEAGEKKGRIRMYTAKKTSSNTQRKSSSTLEEDK
ncbi:MAG: hypothetical protein FJX71_06895 [Alphaproteobacteria bacterium]|nr:hypothetical protein [Alphaproteobacteria bacterium]